jgi:hypothetical protein
MFAIKDSVGDYIVEVQNYTKNAGYRPKKMETNTVKATRKSKA